MTNDNEGSSRSRQGALNLLKLQFEDDLTVIEPSAVVTGNGRSVLLMLPEVADVDGFGEELAAARIRRSAKALDADTIVFWSLRVRRNEDEEAWLRQARKGDDEETFFLVVLAVTEDGIIEASQEYAIEEKECVTYIGEPKITHNVYCAMLDGVFDRRAENAVNYIYVDGVQTGRA